MVKKYRRDYLEELLPRQSLEVRIIVGKHMDEVPDASVYAKPETFLYALRGVFNLTEGEFNHTPGMRDFAAVLWAQGRHVWHARKALQAERKFKKEWRFRAG